MSKITQLPYYFWGSAYPDQFALYSPALNRIILVDHTDLCLEYVCYVMSSRINLLIVPLHTADNFQDNLVDNSCCTHWGVEEWSRHGVKLTPQLFARRDSYYLDACKTLTSVTPAPDHVHDLQCLAMLTVHVVNIFRHGPNVMYTKFYDMLSTPFEFGVFDRIRKQEKQCYDLLHLAENYDTVEPQIRDILDQCELTGI